MTNREKIEKMTVKEFCSMLGTKLKKEIAISEESCKFCAFEENDSDCLCTGCLVGVGKWLDQEAKDESC